MKQWKIILFIACLTMVAGCKDQPSSTENSMSVIDTALTMENTNEAVIAMMS